MLSGWQTGCSSCEKNRVQQACEVYQTATNVILFLIGLGVNLPLAYHGGPGPSVLKQGPAAAEFAGLSGNSGNAGIPGTMESGEEPYFRYRPAQRFQLPVKQPVK